MAVVVWSATAARLAQSCRRANGAVVSIAVWGEAHDPAKPAEYSLRFKQSLDGGSTWPTDGEAVVITALERREPWFIAEVGPMLLVGNGLNQQWSTLRSGEAREHWERTE